MTQKLLCLACTLMFATMTIAADDAPAKKKGKKNAGQRAGVASTVLKQLQDVELTDEQKTKIQELAKKSMTDMRAVRKEAGITPELMKKRAEAQKELKAAGTKQSEMFAAVNKKVGMTEAQVAVLKKANESRQALLKQAIALLSDEQKAKLPKRMLQAGKKKPGNNAGKGKKKKAAEQE